jgi:streptomycin 6-kinase
VVGEPAFEVAALLRNPLSRMRAEPRLGQVLGRRVDQLAGLLGLERRRLVAWGVAQSVLSATWDVEEVGEGWEPAVACAEALAALLPRH